MAVIVRTRRLSNPSKRHRNYGTPAGRSWSATKLTPAEIAKKRASGYKRATTMRANPGRKMSLKQKLHFGTARQRAAARLALRRPNAGVKSIRKSKKRMIKAGFKRSTAVAVYKQFKKRKARGKNIGEIVSISLAGLAGNPGKKRRKTTMAKSRKRVLAGKKAARTRWRRYGNPGVSRRHRTHNGLHQRRGNWSPRMARRRRPKNPARRRHGNPIYAMRRINRGRPRNPGMFGVTSGTIGKALGVIGGAIGSKYLTQLALGGNNTGIMGYGGNLVASIALGWAAGKVMKDKDFGTMVAVGGIAALVLRVLSDNTSIGQYVNLSLSGAGKGGDLGLGIIQDSSFPVPQVAAPGSMTSFLVPRQTRMAISASAAQTASMKAAGSGTGMGRMQGRMARRAIM